MRTVLLLLLSLVLLEAPVAAQERVAGPWRVRYLPTRVQIGSWDEGGYWPDGDLPIDTACHSAKIKWLPLSDYDWCPASDTTTIVYRKRKVQLAPWNVHPDSILLFLDCQNQLLAPATPRGRLSLIRFKATGATVRLDARQRVLLLVPSAPVVVLWAYQGQQLIFRHAFRAVPPPLPIIKCYWGGCNSTIKQGVPNNSVRTITLRALPDKDFAEMLPEDARYRVARFRTTLLRQGKPVQLATGQSAEKMVQGPQGDLSDLASVGRLGDQLQTDVLMVQRMNFCGDILEVPVTRRFVTDGPKCPEP